MGTRWLPRFLKLAGQLQLSWRSVTESRKKVRAAPRTPCRRLGGRWLHWARGGSFLYMRRETGQVVKWSSCILGTSPALLRLISHVRETQLDHLTSSLF
jgi:hypothetical protein